MSGASDYLEVQWLNTLRNTPFSVASCFVGLNTADPTDAAASTELTDSGYARKAVTWNAPTSGAGTMSNSLAVEFNAIADAGPFTVTHVSIWDASTGGNLLMYAPLTVSKQFSQNDVPRFPVGSLVPKVA